MKVAIKPPTQLEARNIKIEKDMILMEPLFYQPKGKATIGLVEVARNDGSIVFRGVLTVNGKTGAVEVLQHTKPVTPALESARKAK